MEGQQTMFCGVADGSNGTANMPGCLTDSEEFHGLYRKKMLHGVKSLYWIRGYAIECSDK